MFLFCQKHFLAFIIRHHFKKIVKQVQNDFIDGQPSINFINILCAHFLYKSSFKAKL